MEATAASPRRPVTTLFMLMSADGKISTGPDDQQDFDNDLPKVPGVQDGLLQYYDLEQQTDLCSLNTGRVLQKVGWNEGKSDIEPIPVTLVMVDNCPHIHEQGIRNLLQRFQHVVVVTTHASHPARQVASPHLTIWQQPQLNMHSVLQRLYQRGIERVTIQSGGQLNQLLLKEKLIDKVSLVVAPLLVGGVSTPTLIDGQSIPVEDMATLQLISATPLQHSFLHLQYNILW